MTAHFGRQAGSELSRMLSVQVVINGCEPGLEPLARLAARRLLWPGGKRTPCCGPRQSQEPARRWRLLRQFHESILHDLRRHEAIAAYKGEVPGVFR